MLAPGTVKNALKFSNCGYNSQFTFRNVGFGSHYG